MKNPLLSYIVPIYNVEEYLDRCIQSLLSQGLDEDYYEIILVNDGSTDGSLTICQHYSDLHKNIRIISQKNAGISRARNTGILNAQGDYLCFVDSDDFLKINGIKDIVQYCSGDVDLVRFWCRIIHPSVKEDLPDGNGNVTFEGTGIDFIKMYGLDTFCWNYLYRREFLLSNHIEFVNVIHEDFTFISDVLFLNPKIISLNSRIYNYVIRESSNTTSRTKECNRRWVDELSWIIAHFVEKLEESRYSDPELFESGMTSLEFKMITLYSRLLSTGYSLEEYKSRIDICKNLGVLPLSRLNGSMKIRLSKRIINFIFNYPFTYLLFKNMYEPLFLKFIKPLLNRNR